MNKMCHESCGSSKEVKPRPDPDDPANPLGPSSMLKPLGLKLDFQGVQGTDFTWEGNDTLRSCFAKKLNCFDFGSNGNYKLLLQCNATPRIRLSLERER